jgi:predicted FMN-binding regulatory protein PaiB
VGIEIDVRQLQGKWKLSQNRSRTDQLAIAADTALPLYSRL